MDITREAQVTASENSLLKAMRTNNVARLDALLHDDLLFNGPAGETATKAINLQNYRSGNMHLHAVAASDQTLHMIGDTAVVAVTVVLKGTYLGQALDGKFRYIRVWKLAESTWKVIAGSVVALNSGG